MWKTAGTFNKQSITKLVDKDTAAKLIISVTYRIQDSFADNTLVECCNVKYEKAFLIVLLIIPQVNKLPDAVITRKKANSDSSLWFAGPDASEERYSKMISLCGKYLIIAFVFPKRIKAAYVTPSSVIAPQSWRSCSFDNAASCFLLLLRSQIGVLPP